MKPRHKRAAIIAGGLAAISLAAFLVLNAFESNLVFFFSPSQVAAGEAPKNRTFRVGGMVKEGSIDRRDLTVSFIVTDTAQEMKVSYTGILARSVPRRQRRGGPGQAGRGRPVHGHRGAGQAR